MMEGVSSTWNTRWWSSLLKIAILYLCLHSRYCQGLDEQLIAQLDSRTPEDWRENWLTDVISTCDGETLKQLGERACVHDPRKTVVKRSVSDRDLFLPSKLAKAFLHYRHRKDSRRRRTTTKTEECCIELTGCVWEELGEYCTFNTRAFHAEGSQP